MCFLFSGAFWGLLLVLLGISIIIRVMFHIHIPLFRIVVALILIYFGIRMLVGGFWPRNCGGEWRGEWRGHTVFNESTVKASTFGGEEHNVVFGKSTVDATDSSLTDQNREFNLNTVFGQTDLRISAAVPTIVKATSAFGSAQFPDGNIITFGDYTYKTKSYAENAPHRKIKVSVVFGGLRVIEQ
jgi:predicted membrane protein